MLFETGGLDLIISYIEEGNSGVSFTFLKTAKMMNSLVKSRLVFFFLRVFLREIVGCKMDFLDFFSPHYVPRV